MEWNFDNDSFKDVDNIEFDKSCPICQQKLLDAKQAKIIEINNYTRTQHELIMLEIIKEKKEKLNAEKEKEHYFLHLCKKHKNKNTIC